MPKEVRSEKKITKKKILETKFLDKKREQKHINSDLSFASYDDYLMCSEIWTNLNFVFAKFWSFLNKVSEN